jgi:2-phosphosulfolactate phosphatase
MNFDYVSLENCSSATGTVIVIDVLRAFSTAAYALQRGVTSICLVSGVQEALDLKTLNPDWLVMGEVQGLPPAGFDLGNSPTQLLERDLSGRTMVQRTSAGTQGVVLTAKAEVLLAASFVVAGATVRYALKTNPTRVTFVLTGGANCAEDLACADYLSERFNGRMPDSAPFIRRVFAAEDAARHLDPAQPEFPRSDLDYCTRIDAFPFAMPVTREAQGLVLHAVLPDPVN